MAEADTNNMTLNNDINDKSTIDTGSKPGSCFFWTFGSRNPEQLPTNSCYRTAHPVQKCKNPDLLLGETFRNDKLEGTVLCQ